MTGQGGSKWPPYARLQPRFKYASSMAGTQPQPIIETPATHAAPPKMGPAADPIANATMAASGFRNSKMSAASHARLYAAYSGPNSATQIMHGIRSTLSV